MISCRLLYTQLLHMCLLCEAPLLQATYPCRAHHAWLRPIVMDLQPELRSALSHCRPCRPRCTGEVLQSPDIPKESTSTTGATQGC